MESVVRRLACIVRALGEHVGCKLAVVVPKLETVCGKFDLCPDHAMVVSRARTDALQGIADIDGCNLGTVTIATRDRHTRIEVGFGCAVV